MNRTYCTTDCGTDEDDGGKESPWRFHASVPKNSGGCFKIRSFVREHASYMSILQSNHHQAMSYFVCNVVMPIVRSSLDLTPSNIIEKFRTKFCITIPYSKAWNARAKTLSKIFKNWELSYETLPQYLDEIKRSISGTVTYYKFYPYSFNMVQLCHVFWAFGSSIDSFSYC